MKQRLVGKPYLDGITNIYASHFQWPKTAQIFKYDHAQTGALQEPAAEKRRIRVLGATPQYVHLCCDPLVPVCCTAVLPFPMAALVPSRFSTDVFALWKQRGYVRFCSC